VDSAWTRVVTLLQRLKETVVVLQSQLNFVLSFLGITEINNLADDSRNVLNLGANNTITNKQPNPTNDHVHHQLAESVGTDGIVVEADPNQTRPSDSYANVVCKPATLSAPFRDAVVSAVYNEFEEKDRRARNIVVSAASLRQHSYLLFLMSAQQRIGPCTMS